MKVIKVLVLLDKDTDQKIDGFYWHSDRVLEASSPAAVDSKWEQIFAPKEAGKVGDTWKNGDVTLLGTQITPDDNWEDVWDAMEDMGFPCRCAYRIVASLWDDGGIILMDGDDESQCVDSGRSWSGNWDDAIQIALSRSL